MVYTKIASKSSPIVTNTNFAHYDWCLNPYVGCQFGCSYCYVRFTVTDPDYSWGDFVRLREHIHTKLDRQLEKASGQRIVMGTMTDPYQPLERKHRLTRAALEAILRMPNQAIKVGIFTKSPLILDDLALLLRLPDPHVHFTISPFNREHTRKTARTAFPNTRRYAAIHALKDAGVKVNVNVAPAIPGLTDGQEERILAKLSELKVDNFYVDPVQPYKQAYEAMRDFLGQEPEWEIISTIIEDREAFQGWKNELRTKLVDIWKKHDNKITVPIWVDHASRTYEHLITRERLGWA